MRFRGSVGDDPISTGPLEGTNNKIRALTRQAYGFRDQEYFTLQLYGKTVPPSFGGNACELGDGETHLSTATAGKMGRQDNRGGDANCP